MTAFVAILLILFFIIAVILVITAFFGGMLGPSFNRYNPFLPRNTADTPGEPACGACGYPTRGIGSFECPECGADLREAGIVTPGMRRGGGAMLGCVLPVIWTLGVFFGGAILGNTASAWLPRDTITTYSVQLHPNTSAYSQVTFEASFREPGTPGYRSYSSSYSGGSGQRLDMSRISTNAQLERVVLRLHGVGNPNSGQCAFEVDNLGNTFRYETGSGQWAARNGAPQASGLNDWFNANQLPTNLPSIAVEADELMQMIDAAQARQPTIQLAQFASHGETQRTFSKPIPVWWRVLYIFICFNVWALGLFRMMRRPKQNAKNL